MAVEELDVRYDSRDSRAYPWFYCLRDQDLHYVVVTNSTTCFANCFSNINTCHRSSHQFNPNRVGKEAMRRPTFDKRHVVGGIGAMIGVGVLAGAARGEEHGSS